MIYLFTVLLEGLFLDHFLFAVVSDDEDGSDNVAGQAGQAEQSPDSAAYYSTGSLIRAIPTPPPANTGLVYLFLYTYSHCLPCNTGNGLAFKP